MKPRVFGNLITSLARSISLALIAAGSLSICEIGRCEEPDLGVLRSEAERVLNLYQRWGLERTDKHYELKGVGELDAAFTSDLPALPARSRVNRYLRNGEQFRVDRTDRNENPESYAFDGHLARYRGQFATYNGNPQSLLDHLSVEHPPEVPHFVMSPGMFLVNFRWLFGTRVAHSQISIDVGTESDLRKIDFDEVNGEPCWRLVLIFQDTQGDVIRNTVWLSRERDLVPVKMINSRLAFGQEFIFLEYHLNDATRWGEEEQSVWLPASTTTCLDYGNNTLRVDSTFEVLEELDAAGLYTNVPMRSKSVGVKRPLSTNPYIPAPVFDQFAATANRFSGLSSMPGLRRWGPAVLAGLLILACVCIPLLRRYTQFGARVQNWFAEHPLIILSIGIILAGVTYYYASFPKGWQQYGISMVLASFVGFGMIGLTMLVAGRRVISLKMMFVIAACSALLFAGYNQGFQKLRTRQAMINDIRSAGGQIHLISWEMRPDGISMPPPLGEFVPEAWTSQLTSAAIPAEIFDRRHTRSWCLEESEYLSVARLDYEPFNVKHEALDALAGAPDMWRIDFNRGMIDDDHFDAFSTLPALESLGFDCAGEPLPERLKDLSGLTELRLTRARVDQQFYETLASLPKLETVLLSIPEFDAKTPIKAELAGKAFQELKWVNVHNATLDAAACKSLGAFPAELMVTDCSLVQKNPRKIELPQTRAFHVRSSAFRDQDLLMLETIPNVAIIQMSSTNVTLNGFETFSSRFPHLAMRIE